MFTIVNAPTTNMSANTTNRADDTFPPACSTETHVRKSILAFVRFDTGIHKGVLQECFPRFGVLYRLRIEFDEQGPSELLTFGIFSVAWGQAVATNKARTTGG